VPTPKAKDLKPNEILVEVKAFSINVDDINVAEGSFLGGLPGMQRKKSKSQEPLVIGNDFAGVIAAVGDKVDASKYKVGQRVCGHNKSQAVFGEMGTWSEYTITKPKNIVPIPNEVSFKEAAALVLPLYVIDGLLEVIRTKNIIQSGKRASKVVVIGASGGIGSVLISSLRKLYTEDELHITGVCSGRNEKFVKDLGANLVVDYTKGPIERTLMKEGGEGPYHAVFDLVGGQSSYKSAKAILRNNRKGRFVTVVGPVEWLGDRLLSGWEQSAWVGRILWKSVMNLVPFGSHPYYHLVAPTDMGKATFQLAFENGIRAPIEKTVAFEDSAGFKDAVKLVRSHRAKGKVLVEMAK